MRVTLRPRSLGELCDVAVVLVVRNATPLLAIAFPYALYVAWQSASSGIHRPNLPESVSTFFADSVISGWFSTAMCLYLAPAVLGGTSSLAETLRRAIALLFGNAILSTLAVAAMLASFVIIFFPPFVFLWIFKGLGASPGSLVHDIMWGFTIVSTVFSGCVALVALSAIGCIWTCSLLAHMVDGASMRTSIRSAVHRALSSRMRLRFFLAWAMPQALFSALWLGSHSLIVHVYGVDRGLVPNALMGAAESLIWLTLSSAFYIVFYYDVRIRVEAFDLEQAARTISLDEAASVALTGA